MLKHAVVSLVLACGPIVAECADVGGHSPAVDPAFGDFGRAWVEPAYHGLPPSRAAYVVLAPDGGVLVALRTQLYRYDARGVLDETFGYGETWPAGGTPGVGAAVVEVGRPVLRRDGGIVVPVLARADNVLRLAVLRLGTDGKRDRAFGHDGLALSQLSPTPYGDAGLAGAAVEDDGRIVVVGWTYRIGTVARRIVFARFLPDGRPDPSFGTDGRRDDLREPAEDMRLVAGPQGEFLIFHRESAARPGVALRFLPGGEPDNTFGPAQPMPSDAWRNGVAYGAFDGTGGVLLAATYSCSGWDCEWWVGLSTLARRDRVGAVDRSFGDDGTLAIYGLDGVNDYGLALAREGLAVDASGGVVLLGREGFEHDAALGQLLSCATVLRLSPHGRIDPAMSNGGRARLCGVHGMAPLAVAVAPDGSVVVLTDVGLEKDFYPTFPSQRRVALQRVRLQWDLPDGDARVLEYFHADYGHYFMSADPWHQVDLAAWYSPWKPTGVAFRAWSQTGTGLAPMCRFYSRDTFAPKSTHFYTPNAAECAALKAQPQWQYEADAFAVALPEGLGAARGCPAGTVPLYRLFNNGAGGAPNHRYVTDAATRDAMLARGWIAEGDGPDRIFACVAAR